MVKPFSKSLTSFLSNWGFSWGGVIDNRHGEWWLAAQIFLISAHLLPPFKLLGRLEFNFTYSFVGIYILIFGMFFSIGALITLGKNLSPLPEPKPGADLVRKGMYKYCRHPLYLGILICSFGVFIYLRSIIHIFLFICLCILLRGKALREERGLLIRHPDYNFYRKYTPAIFPWIPFLDWRS